MAHIDSEHADQSDLNDFASILEAPKEDYDRGFDQS
jgi:hypothetical protein